ncbi:MAG: Type 1 glutamine amidotransferase-like domain-containing protein [Flavobacteriaceae bacterium]|jgi:dipeptidase E|nr:Type 1 glutamine amidotransferase-like domain-containing protein [Flavobacteriaceae bacterium]
MKKLFLAASFADVASLFPSFVGENTINKKVCFIPTASIVEEYTGHVTNDKNAFEQLGMQVEVLEISTANINTIKQCLQTCDYIFVSGGNTFYLLQELKNKGVDRLIVEQIESGKVYIGTSAGSVIMTKDIQYLEAMDDKTKAPKLTDTSALGLIENYPLVHYNNFPFTEVANIIYEEYHNKLPLLTLSNHEVLLVSDKQIEKQQVPH